ncbi:pro-neuregulin-4, membrane-bound isoform isoform X5 [Pelodiscus sinensis]|uniref:pro-neuregulin-4, membrane-bound isoform isoform X5 n=1 Tax=Pelodiscus sinensis TaxID=13735 RepID=UPI003F6C3948
MRTDHEELCGTSYGPFCLNGGICYMIPTVSGPFCRKAQIPRAISTEYGAGLAETSSSDGCNSGEGHQLRAAAQDHLPQRPGHHRGWLCWPRIPE